MNTRQKWLLAATTPLLCLGMTSLVLNGDYAHDYNYQGLTDAGDEVTAQSK